MNNIPFGKGRFGRSVRGSQVAMLNGAALIDTLPVADP